MTEHERQYEYWRAEEQRHAEAYLAYMSKFLGDVRFKKQIKHHVDRANEAQREMQKYRALVIRAENQTR